MTDSFDFDSFISSPVQMDAIPIQPHHIATTDSAANKVPPFMMASYSDQGLDSGILGGNLVSSDGMAPPSVFGSFVDSYGNSVVPPWDPNSHLNNNNFQNNAMPAPAPVVAKDSTLSYRNQIAAHHSHLLKGNTAVPPVPAGFFSSRSTSSVPRMAGTQQSQPKLQRLSTMPKPNSAAMTLQERRRLTRHLAKAAPEPVAGRGAKRASTGDSSVSAGPAKAVAVPSMQTSSQGIVATTPSMNPVPSNVLPCQYQTANGEPLSTDSKYSTSGIDVLGILSRAITRPNPRIALGFVDLSCSFTISDARHPEQPLIYASDTFCKLTGYSLPEILGKNCRFLQAPNLPLAAGSPRQHTDARAVEHLKRHLVQTSECQASLINYRKDGTPFINLVTVVPVSWTDPTQIDFLIGFQIDLIEQSNAILDRKPDGSYVVNYRPTNEASGLASEEIDEQGIAEADANKQAAIAADIKELICGDGPGDAKQWSRVLLENAHDLVYVLSLKGTFLYVSPSITRLLGYSVSEVIGKSISEYCHPSDVVPLFRELKDSTSNASIAAAASRNLRTEGVANPPTKGGGGQAGPRVNLIFRMRHKTQGHCWIESTGKLHLEQGKGRKVVISSGRPRPVYDLSWDHVRQSARVAASCFWSKMSTEGLVLNCTGAIADVLGCDERDLFGRHLLELTRREAAPSLLQSLRATQPMCVSHLMGDGVTNNSPVLSTFYPSSIGSVDALSSMFVHIQSATSDSAWMRPNVAYPKAKDDADPNLESLSSVFAELSPSRGSSWVFEMHQLKNVNKKLKDELKALRRKSLTSSVTADVLKRPGLPESCSSSSAVVSHIHTSSPIKRRPDHGHGHRQHLRPTSSLAYLHANNSSIDNAGRSSSSSSSTSSAEILAFAAQRRRDGRSGSGDASDETAPTTSRSSASASEKEIDSSEPPSQVPSV